MKPRPVYSVRRARKELVAAIHAEVRSAMGWEMTMPHSAAVARREAAMRDLVAAVRAEGKR